MITGTTSLLTFNSITAITTGISQNLVKISMGILLICGACTSSDAPAPRKDATPPIPTSRETTAPAPSQRTEPTPVPSTPTAMPERTDTEAHPSALDIHKHSRESMEKVSSFKFNLDAELAIDTGDVQLTFIGNFESPDRVEGIIDTGSGTTERLMRVGDKLYLESSSDPIEDKISFILLPAQIIQAVLSDETNLTFEEEATLNNTRVYHLSGLANKRDFRKGTGEFRVGVWVDTSNYELLELTVEGALDLGTDGDPVIGNLAKGIVPVNLTIALSEFGSAPQLSGSSTPSIAIPRTYHTATLLPDGRVLVLGGLRNIEPGLLESEIYDPSSGEWSMAQSMQAPHLSHTATLLDNGNVLVIGPEWWGGSGHLIRIVELYDHSSGTWSTVGEMRPQTFHTSVLLHDGAVMSMGGWLDLSNTTSISRIYEPTTNTWFNASRMSQPRAEHTATVLNNGNVLVTGGAGGPTKPALSSAELWDYQTETWNPASSMQHARSLLTATLLTSGKVLVAGGRDAQGMALSSSEEYDPESDTWSGVSDMNQGRMFHTSTLLYDGRVLVTGGSAEPLIMDPWRDIFDARLGILGEGKTLASVEIFDPATGAWTTLQDMEIARKVHTATILPDGVVLIVGGTTLSGSATSSFELYDPASQTDTNDSTSIP
jgi:hypothetical protein